LAWQTPRASKAIPGQLAAWRPGSAGCLSTAMTVSSRPGSLNYAAVEANAAATSLACMAEYFPPLMIMIEPCSVHRSPILPPDSLHLIGGQ
jgi:hypothetical protein